MVVFWPPDPRAVFESLLVLPPNHLATSSPQFTPLSETK